MSGLILLNLVEFFFLKWMKEFVDEVCVVYDMVIFDMLFIFVVVDV